MGALFWLTVWESLGSVLFTLYDQTTPTENDIHLAFNPYHDLEKSGQNRDSQNPGFRTENPDQGNLRTDFLAITDFLHNRFFITEKINGLWKNHFLPKINDHIRKRKSTWQPMSHLIFYNFFNFGYFIFSVMPNNFLVSKIHNRFLDIPLIRTESRHRTD